MAVHLSDGSNGGSTWRLLKEIPTTKNEGGSYRWGPVRKRVHYVFRVAAVNRVGVEYYAQSSPIHRT